MIFDSLIPPIVDSDIESGEEQLCGGSTWGRGKDGSWRVAVKDLQPLTKEIAERESRANRIFLAALSHELRTPLQGIMGSLQLIKHASDPQALDDLVDRGEKAGRRLLRLIDQSLDLERIGTGTSRLNPEIVEFRSFFDELMEEYGNKVLDRDLDFHWDISRNVPERGDIDPHRLRQILTNLMNNSLKFTTVGFISFEVDYHEESVLGKRALSYSVSDSGRGFPREFREMIFTPFTQVRVDAGPNDCGIGLGLAITRELVGLMGGMMTVASACGIGSRFSVILPFGDASLPEAPADVDSLVSLPRFRGSVLVAEDDDISGDMVKRMLEALGLWVDLAGDGREVLEKTRLGFYDLVLMDYWMPGLSGVEVTRQLRSQPGFVSCRVPIIGLTARVSPLDAAECYASGMNYFLTKPVDFERLVDLLQVFLPPP